MEEATKVAYVSPPHGVLEITLIRDANPRVTISLDLGIPNFTVFSMTLPLAEGQPQAMSELIAEAVSVLCDEVASFMLAMEYEERVITLIYATVLATFKTMSTESDPSKEQDAIGADPTVQIYEGTFNIPMDFINETQNRVVTAAVRIDRSPKVRHIELTYSPKQKTKPSDTARVIRQYRNRSLKQQPKPMFVIVYDQVGRATGTISVGPGKNFKNELLKAMHKKGSVDFTAPVSFVNEQEMKSSPLNGIPRAISVGGMTYQPEAMAGPDMALYHGPQDWIVKFPDGRSTMFPGRPTFSKMRTLNFPVPRNRIKWTMIPEDSLQQEQEYEASEDDVTDPPVQAAAPQEEVKEAATPDGGERPELRTSKDSVQPDQIMTLNGNMIYLKPTKTYDDLVHVETLKKRLVRDGLAGKPILEGLMIIDRIGYYGTFQGKSVIVIPQYYVRRYGVQRDDGTYSAYHKRNDGKAQKVGLRPLTAEEFLQPKPVESGIENKEGI